VNLDGFALPVKKLKGTDPIETLDLSGNNLGVSSAVVIASLIGVNGALTSIDLSNNQLCGVWTDDCGHQNGTYTAEGITAIADALRVNGALTKLSLAQNKLEEAGTQAICEALEQNKMLKEVAKQKGISLCGILRDQTTADFSNKYLKPPDTILLASDLSQAVVTGALTATNLLGNWFDAESAKMLAEVAKQKGISLCGILRDQTTADFSNKYLKPPDAILLASDLSQAVVTGAVTVTNLLGNQLDMKSAKMLAEVAKQKDISLCGIQRDQTTANFSFKGLKPPDAILLASDLSHAVVTGVLTALDLSFNDLKDEGVSAVCEAIKSNKETKLASLNVKDNGIGPVGANAVAAMVAVTGGLTALNLSSNRLLDEGVSAVCKAIQSNKETKLSSLNFKDNGMGPVGAKSVAAMVAVICTLTECNLRSNSSMGEEAQASIRNAVQGKAWFKLRL
jgi:Ran GTPase-activating protein (RanGAP) involved in mRNA processing and transport